MSITAVSSEIIDKRGLTGMEDYLPSIAGVTMHDRGASQNSIVIRGIASDPQIENSTVGVYFGEIPITSYGSSSNTDTSGSANIKLVDMERIEVLRGPQGTLYGSSSMGGTVRAIPKAPDLERMEGKVMTTFSQTAEQGGDNTMFQGAISVPVIEDKLAIRAVAYRFDDSGYVENVAGNEDVQQKDIDGNGLTLEQDILLGATAKNESDIGAVENKGYRLSVLWRPIEELDITLNYIDQEVDQSGIPSIDLWVGDYQQARLQLTGNTRSGRTEEFILNEMEITNLVVNYNLGWGNITSSSSWIDYNSVSAHDFGFGFTESVEGDIEEEGFSEELRFASVFDGPLQVVAGLYYEDRELTSKLYAQWIGDPAISDISGEVVETKPTTEKAIFGELAYDITDNLVATLGARTFELEQEYSVLTTGQFTGGEPNLSVSEPTEEKDQTYKANLSYTPNDDLLVYGQWAEGFRHGRPQFVPPVAEGCDVNGDGLLDGTDVPLQPDGLESDTTESYEIGAKKTYYDSRLTVNASAYRINWDGIPQFVSSGLCGAYVNVGEAKSEGVEVEVQAILAENLLINFSASYGESTLTEDSSLGEEGTDLPGSADFSAAFGFDYGFSLLEYDGFVRGDYTYVGEYYHDFAKTSPVSGGYSKFDFKVGVKVEQFDIELFVNNLTNADELVWVEKFNIRGQRANQLRPRTTGINLAYRF